LGETHPRRETGWSRRDLRDLKKGKQPCQGYPKVTGVLPVALEDATKVVHALLGSGKEYVCVMKLHQKLPENTVKEVLEEFQGKIFQRPPIRASVKRQLRVRKVYYLEVLEVDERNVLFKVGCEAGTYIRKLCHDVGEVLGCGAHMHELRRTRSGPFTETRDIVTLHDVAYLYSEWQKTHDPNILRKFIQPMEKALELLPKINVRDSAVDALCHGAHLTAPGVASLETGIEAGSKACIFTLKGEAVALATATATTQEILRKNHGIVARNDRVLMPRGTYPKLWHSKK
jgi:H/ACA ribonucleoprotein complex subunit 4